MVSYGSTIEAEDVKLLEKLGFEVLNPSDKKYQDEFKEYLKNNSDDVMGYFSSLVKSCQLVAFRSLPSGQILSGIGKELETALENKISIIELPCSIESRTLPYKETKRFLIELGHYKQ